MTALNPITALRLKRAKSRRAPMPVSKKPRGPRREATGPNPYTPAGTLLYGFYEAAAMRKLGGPTIEEMERRARTQKPRQRRRPTTVSIGFRSRQNPGGGKAGLISFYPAAGAESREAKRRAHQRAHLAQHPSVVERFKNHPTRAQIDAEIARVEAA